MLAAIDIEWRARATPLEPCAALAAGAVAARLARRLLTVGDRGGVRLRAVAGAGLLCVLGDAEALPWVDGIEYLGRDPRAPALRMPTSLEPSLHPELLERALLHRADAVGGRPPLAVTCAPPRLFSLASAQLVSAAGLRAWLEVA